MVVCVKVIAVRLKPGYHSRDETAASNYARPLKSTCVILLLGTKEPLNTTTFVFPDQRLLVALQVHWCSANDEQQHILYATASPYLDDI